MPHLSVDSRDESLSDVHAHQEATVEVLMQQHRLHKSHREHEGRQHIAMPHRVIRRAHKPYDIPVTHTSHKPYNVLVIKHTEHTNLCYLHTHAKLE